MHGLGNDFVVVDAREKVISIKKELITQMADRNRGIGFDQLAIITNRPNGIHLAFYNSDGSISFSCGNATRCIARYLMDETGAKKLDLNTDHGTLVAIDIGNQKTAVNMGHPSLDWRDIPLSKEVDTLHLPLEGDPIATGMGNPHCTFFTEKLELVDIEAIGKVIENHPLFPQGTNVQFASIVGEDHIRMRVWERGAGLTLASGSSSCATAVAAVRRGLTKEKVTVELDGGSLLVDWADDGVWLTGPTMHVFSGYLTASFLEKFL